MKNENKPFEYTYSAKEQTEIKKIREKYLQPEKEEDDKMERVRRLDESVTKKATSVALIIGIIGALVMGTGMSFIMTDLGEIIGTPLDMIIGIVLGLIGMVGVAMAYPIYQYVIKVQKKRVAPEIIRLTDELMK